jgi:hypothetical protein
MLLGGGSNAYTEAEQTVFHFDCSPAALRGTRPYRFLIACLALAYRFALRFPYQF